MCLALNCLVVTLSQWWKAPAFGTLCCNFLIGRLSSSGKLWYYFNFFFSLVKKRSCFGFDWKSKSKEERINQPTSIYYLMSWETWPLEETVIALKTFGHKNNVRFCRPNLRSVVDLRLSCSILMDVSLIYWSSSNIYFELIFSNW